LLKKFKQTASWKKVLPESSEIVGSNPEFTARSSSSKNPQLPQQQQRAPGEKR
jgi:hypothetical protein